MDWETTLCKDYDCFRKEEVWEIKKNILVWNNILKVQIWKSQFICVIFLTSKMLKLVNWLVLVFLQTNSMSSGNSVSQNLSFLT